MKPRIGGKRGIMQTRVREIILAILLEGAGQTKFGKDGV
jgi:hypothetical protein